MDEIARGSSVNGAPQVATVDARLSLLRATLETPSPRTALGAKGVGEGGAIPSLAAIRRA